MTNSKISKYYQNESRFNGICSRYDLSKKIKDGAYVVNLDEYADVGTHWIALYLFDNDPIYFESYGAEHLPKEIRHFIRNKNMQTNIFRIQANDSIVRGYLWIGFIDYTLGGKTC